MLGRLDHSYGRARPPGERETLAAAVGAGGAQILPGAVGRDQPDAAEWSTAADGKHKRACAAALIRRLRDRFAPGSLLHFGQGKWYPGEPLPRWAFALYWRRDVVPLWRYAALISDDSAGRAADARPCQARPVAWARLRDSASTLAAISRTRPVTMNLIPAL